MPLIGYAEAWSAPTEGEIVATPVFLGGRTAAEVDGDEGLAQGGDRHDAARRRGSRARTAPQPARRHAGADRPAAVGDAAPNQADTRRDRAERCARRAPPS